jgi:hypothetical protein
MALEEFEREEMSSREKGYVRMRSVMDYGMGTIIAGIGVFILLSKWLTPELKQLEDPWIKGFGAMALIYGAFRVYRGYKKNYFINR